MIELLLKRSCPFCSFVDTFSTSSTVRSHVRKQHNVDLPTQKNWSRQPIPRTLPYSASRSELYPHVPVGYMCICCPDIMSDRSSLRTHVITYHISSEVHLEELDLRSLSPFPEKKCDFVNELEEGDCDATDDFEKYISGPTTADVALMLNRLYQLIAIVGVIIIIQNCFILYHELYSHM